jgi:hypothetical protein
MRGQFSDFEHNMYQREYSEKPPDAQDVQGAIKFRILYAEARDILSNRAISPVE